MPSQRNTDRAKALEQQLQRCTIAIATQFRGLTVADMQGVRRKLRERGVDYVVVKNTLAGIAADATQKPLLREIIQGPTAIAFGYGDVVEPAKTLMEHIGATRVALIISGAITDGQLLNADAVRALAALPPRQVLMSQVAGGLLAPLYGLSYVLAYHIGGLARALEARRQQLEGAAS